MLGMVIRITNEGHEMDGDFYGIIEGSQHIVITYKGKPRYIVVRIPGMTEMTLRFLTAQAFLVLGRHRKAPLSAETLREAIKVIVLGTPLKVHAVNKGRDAMDIVTFTTWDFENDTNWLRPA